MGPTDNEREFVEDRLVNFKVGDAPRNAGSFTSSFGLASFLVPAGVFALVLAYMDARRRALAAVVFLLSMIGLIASYIRTALVGVVAGALALAAFVITGRDSSTRRRRYALALVVLVLVGGYGATLAAGTADERAGDRAVSLLNPLGDDSLQTRFDTWEASLDRVVDEPRRHGPGHPRPRDHHRPRR